MFWLYPTFYCPINAKFGIEKQNHTQTYITWPKYQISKIQHGGRPPIWIWLYCYITVGNRPISIMFGEKTQIFVPWTVTWQSQNSANSIWRMLPYWKSFWLYLNVRLTRKYRGLNTPQRNSMCWFAVERPYMKLLCELKLSVWSCLRYFWILHRTRFSVPRSPRTMHGHPPRFATSLTK